MASPSLLILFSFAITTAIASAANCNSTAPLVGFQSDLSMLSHQLRGHVNITSNCSFTVHSFDMLAASQFTHFRLALAPDLQNLSLGSPASPLLLNRSFNSENLTFPVFSNVSFSDFNVLSVWDPTTSSDFGHIILHDPSHIFTDNSTDWSNFDLLSPAPAPAEDQKIMNNTFIYLNYRQPTMFDNCLTLSNRVRVRWSLNLDSDSIQIGLEAAIGSEYYLAFGWAATESNSSPMVGSDVTVVGFTEEGMPFAEDYFITDFTECLINKDGKVQGVCPDTIYEGSDPIGLVNNSMLIYGHRRDGVSLVRYVRPLESVDNKYDVPVAVAEEMTVVWAMGPMRPPDTLRPYYLPQNHGGPQGTTYGYLKLNVSKEVNDCVGPLDAEVKEDQLIVADGKTPLVVSSGPAVLYPNPPNPAKVIYINKKEAPFLRVERGVPVTFSVQAGHDVALYITSDPIGGNATTRNTSEVIYAGGPLSEGVQASPTELVWLPDRNTPDMVYYQSVFTPKMGWKVQVVDGGLSDMYNSSVLLDDQQVTFFWTLSPDSISIAVRGEKKSGYVAIGFGGGMINSYAYVGWVDDTGKGHVDTYWIDGKDALSVHPTSENLTYVRCRSENGMITFEFTRPLFYSCRERKECSNSVDPTTPLKVVWAMGSQWAGSNLSETNMHSVTSSRPVRVLLLRGSAEAEQDLRPVLGVHGFMMFVAWGILLPGGIMAARYLRHFEGDGWYRIHVYLQYSGISIVFLGVLFAAAELRGFYISSVHVKLGITAIVLACAQPINAYIRPDKPSNGEVATTKRMLWEYFHVIVGRSAILFGVAALFSGMKHLEYRYGSANGAGLMWALILWVLAVVLLVLYLEYMEIKRRRTERNTTRGSWVLGNSDEDDSADLLQSNRDVSKPGVMEVQLEPLRK